MRRDNSIVQIEKERKRNNKQRIFFAVTPQTMDEKQT